MKSSLVVDLSEVADQSVADRYNVPLGTTLLMHDFVLVSDTDARDLRDRNSTEALESLGLKVEILDGLPVPEVD